MAITDNNMRQHLRAKLQKREFKNILNGPPDFADPALPPTATGLRHPQYRLKDVLARNRGPLLTFIHRWSEKNNLKLKMLDENFTKAEIAHEQAIEARSRVRKFNRKYPDRADLSPRQAKELEVLEKDAVSLELNAANKFMVYFSLLRDYHLRAVEREIVGKADDVKARRRQEAELEMSLLLDAYLDYNYRPKQNPNEAGPEVDRQASEEERWEAYAKARQEFFKSADEYKALSGSRLATVGSQTARVEVINEGGQTYYVVPRSSVKNPEKAAKLAVQEVLSLKPPKGGRGTPVTIYHLKEILAEHKQLHSKEPHAYGLFDSLFGPDNKKMVYALVRESLTQGLKLKSEDKMMLIEAGLFTAEELRALRQEGKKLAADLEEQSIRMGAYRGLHEEIFPKKNSSLQPSASLGTDDEDDEDKATQQAKYVWGRIKLS